MPGGFRVTMAAVVLILLLPIVRGDELPCDENAIAQTAVPPHLPPVAPDPSRWFQSAAERIRPSVVSIHSERRVMPQRDSRSNRRPQVPEEFERYFGDDFFERLFRDRYPQRGYVQRGLGTGVIVSKAGYIVTNSHVIRGASEVQVHLEDGRDFDAKVIGSDNRSEIAVIKIEATGLQVAELGDSDRLKVGEWVLAVGNPFQLSQTVTAGIVSARGRSNVGITDYEDFIQTDAAVNPGNSGGPLINLQGEVVGINTAIASRTGGYMGIGFAIPSNMIKKVMRQLIEHGHVERSMIGAVIQPLTRELAASFGYNGSDGVLVSDVVADGPAEKAGLASGDIITRLNGRPAKSTSDLRNAIAEISPGTVVNIEFVRSGKAMNVSVTLTSLADQTDETETPATTSEPDKSRLGLTVQDVDPELMVQLGNDRNQQGVIVKDVIPGGSADDAGISESDVIIAVNGRTVTDTASFSKAVTESDLSGGVRLQLVRQGTRTFVFLKHLQQKPESQGKSG